MSTVSKSLAGTQTEKNIVAAYMNEAQSYSRYTFYAQQADKESYYPIGQVFRMTADNELHHAKVFFKMLQGGQVTAPVAVDAGVIGDTATNLQLSINEEENEGYKAYLEAAKVAMEEGFPEVASHFTHIAAIEARHRDRFQKFLDQVKAGTVWKRDKPIKWQCLVCGYVFEGTEPPAVCPACDHPKEHYMPMDIDAI